MCGKEINSHLEVFNNPMLMKHPEVQMIREITVQGYKDIFLMLIHCTLIHLKLQMQVIMIWMA